MKKLILSYLIATAVWALACALDGDLTSVAMGHVALFAVFAALVLWRVRNRVFV